jgi:subtilase family serine protease
MGHMVLHLQSSAEQETQLEALIARQTDPKSPNYREFLTPQEFAAQFGVSASDIAKVTGWLQSHGLTVEEVPAGNRAIIFSGNASQVGDAFNTEIRQYNINGVQHLANAGDPQIPAAFAGIVGGVLKLCDFRYQPYLVKGAPIASAQSIGAMFNLGAGMNLLGPADYYTIYDINPLLSAGINGAGQTIAVLARSDIYLSDVQSFRSMFGLTANDPEFIVTNSDPGQVDGDNVETTLDTEWAGAVAPDASIKVIISSSSGSSDGIDLSATYAVNNNVAPIISLSYGGCEAGMGSTELAFYNSLWEQAAAQGQTVVVAAGDSGAAGCDSSSASKAVDGKAVNGLCSSPYSTCVGGTEFVEGSNPGQYWLPANNSTTLASALSYIPETTWNESGTASLAAGGGGASTVYAKPSWQTGAGVPADAKRDVPDVSLTAAMHDGYTVVQGGEIGYIFPVGGTSAATASFAALIALVNQKQNSSQGCINPVLYPLAVKQAAGGESIFHDITTGNNSVPGQTGFSAGKGYDLTTGLGSVDANNLVNHWNDAAAAPMGTLTISTYATTVSQGQTSTAAVKTTTGGISSAVALTASGMPTGVTASFSAATIASPGSGTTTLNIAATSTATPGNYTLTVTGTAGSQTAESSFTLTVLAPSFGLAVPTAALGMQNGQTITAVVGITPQNGFKGTVTLSATGLPAGVTATFSPATLSGSKAATSVMSIVAAKSAHGGSYGFHVTATGGSMNQTASINLAVNVVPSCRMVFTPAAITLTPGGATSVALTCPSAGSAISMSPFGTPSGITATLSSSTLAVNGSVSMTVSATSTAVQGSSVMGIYATEANGALQEPNIAITVSGPNAALTLNPSTVMLSPGGSATVGVSWSSSGFPNANIAVGGRPQGVSVSFGAVTATGGSLTFSASSAAVNGKYTILLQVMSGVFMRTATLNVVIAPQPTCTLATNPASISLLTGSSTTVSVTCPVTQGSFSAPLSLSAAALSSTSTGSSASGGVTGVTIQAPGNLTAGSSASVTIASASTAMAGTYQLQLTASGSGFTKTIAVPLTVAAPPVCSFAAAPSSVSVAPGHSTATKLSCTVTQGAFTSPLSLTLASVPTGVTTQLSPATLTAGSSTTLTLSAVSSAKAGTATLSLTASGSGFTQTITIAVTVAAP